MTMNKSDYLRDKLINHTLRGVTFTAPSAWFIALFTVTPTSAGGGTEVTGGSYARQAVTFSASSGGATSNSGPINFPTPTLDWGHVTGVAVFDASSAGNMLYFGDLGTARDVFASDAVSFASSFFQISEK